MRLDECSVYLYLFCYSWAFSFCSPLLESLNVHVAFVDEADAAVVDFVAAAAVAVVDFVVEADIVVVAVVAVQVAVLIAGMTDVEAADRMVHLVASAVLFYLDEGVSVLVVLMVLVVVYVVVVVVFAAVVSFVAVFVV